MDHKPKRSSLNEALEPSGDGACDYQDTESWLPPGDCDTGDVGDDDFMLEDDGDDSNG